MKWDNCDTADLTRIQDISRSVWVSLNFQICWGSKICGLWTDTKLFVFALNRSTRTHSKILKMTNTFPLHTANYKYFPTKIYNSIKLGDSPSVTKFIIWTVQILIDAPYQASGNQQINIKLLGLVLCNSGYIFGELVRFIKVTKVNKGISGKVYGS